MNESDMDVLEFARKISMLSTDTPLSNEYDKEHGQENKRWWSSQREHLTVWCLHYPTGGVEGFRHNPSNSAVHMYNYFGRPETLLWLIEALIKERKEQFDLQELIDEIQNEKQPKPSSVCAKIRKKVPFKKIVEWLSA